MKKSFVMAILLVSSFQVFSQKPVRVTRAEGVVIQKKLVVLFENSNFSGASKSFGPGEYLLTDFNDQAASIRVPDGLVAYLYEHASQGKGYGIAVDLLEDGGSEYPSIQCTIVPGCCALREIISMYGPEMPWLTDNLFRDIGNVKANPGPPNTVAVVSPPIEAHYQPHPGYWQ
jgi:hypothetical protein